MRDIWFFLGLFKPYKNWLIAGILLSLLTSLSSIGLLTLAAWFISAAAVAGVLAPDGVAITFNFMQPAAQIRALAIIRTLGRYAERVITHEATFRVLSEIRCWFFSRLIPLVPGCLSAKRSGDILNTMTADIDALDALYLRLLIPMAVVLLGTIAVSVFVYSYSAWLSVLLIMMMFFSAVIVPFLFNRLGRSAAKSEVELSALFKTQLIEILQGLGDLLAYRAYQRFNMRLLKGSQNLIDIQRHSNALSAWALATAGLLAHFTMLSILIGSAGLYQQQIISGPVLAMLVFCVLALFEGVNPVVQAMLMLGKTSQAAHRVRAVADLPPIIFEPGEPLDLPSKNDIVIEHVNFKYPGSGDWVLQDISLKIPQGRKVALLGQNGAGKTSLLHLLMRFFDPQHGQITLADEDIKRFRSRDLISRFALLSQHNQIFSGSILDNLLIAKPEASSIEIRHVLDQAGLSHFISTLPEGIETWVGENGVRVSGGEARRIALARLFLKDAPIVLLDEPTEGLDADTEKQILQSIQQYSLDKTLVMVTHRRVGLQLVDQIYRIRGGRLQGSDPYKLH